MTPVIISGGIDLSVGSVLALTATLTGSLLMGGGTGVWPMVGIVLAAGCLCGLVSGLVVTRWRIQPFIATLAMMSAARGISRYLSGGAAVPLGFGDGGAPASFRALAAPVVPYVPVPAALFLASVRFLERIDRVYIVIFYEDTLPLSCPDVYSQRQISPSGIHASTPY